MPKANTKPTITARLCQSKPAERIKVKDNLCPGLYVSVTTKGVATFFLRYWDRVLGRQVTVRLGIYDDVHFDVDRARSVAWSLKGRVGAGEDVATTARQAKAGRAKLTAKTVADLIDEYKDWMQELEVKKDGGQRARVETWNNYLGYLNRFLLPTLGRMIASEVTNEHIAKLIKDVRHGKVKRKYKGTPSNARQTQNKVSAFFTWAASADRRYVLTSPCHNLPKLEPKGEGKRVLDEDEIHILWHGLDRDDLPCPRSVALGLKFALCTMLRPKEFLTAEPRELSGLNTQAAQIRVPLMRVKKRRVIVQPLSSLAQEILAEAITEPGQAVVFRASNGNHRGEKLDRCAMATALRGKWDSWGKKRNWQPGICEILGLKKFTPYDLRRTAASLASDLGFTNANIGLCLDHTAKGKDAGAPVTRVYARGGVIRKNPVLDTKRQILDAIDVALRDIIGMTPMPEPLPLAA